MQPFTLFISDLHLSPAYPKATELFQAFLAKQAPEADALYILGDLFDVWIGDDDPSDFAQEIKSRLKAATSNGTPIYFMRGNRDFLIGERFAKNTGVILLEDPVCIDLYGRPTLLMHGDTLCTDDQHYLRAKKRLNNKAVQTIFMALPIRVRRAIASKLRSASQRHIERVDENTMCVSQAAVERSMSLHRTQTLIHGHTHKPHIHSFMLAGKKAHRCVLGAWHTKANALLCQDDGELRFFAP